MRNNKTRMELIQELELEIKRLQGMIPAEKTEEEWEEEVEELNQEIESLKERLPREKTKEEVKLELQNDSLQKEIERLKTKDYVKKADEKVAEIERLKDEILEDNRKICEDRDLKIAELKLAHKREIEVMKAEFEHDKKMLTIQRNSIESEKWAEGTVKEMQMQLSLAEEKVRIFEEQLRLERQRGDFLFQQQHPTPQPPRPMGAPGMNGDRDWGGHY